jgi:hypothetical protein
MSEYLMKNPATTLVHSFDWAEFLSGETIAVDQGWAIHPDSISTGALVIGGETLSGTTTSAEISGGLPGEAYLISSTIRTDTGREIQRSILLRVAST